ncbi:MAG: nucleotidyltransferase family protein [Christensenellales bacterium]
MKKYAIIAEYNPFHSGHLYHLNETRKVADRIIVVLSGSFTQRGDAAVENKYRRAQNAIYSGADIVIELPTLYAISPADKFAYGAIKTLSALDVDYLSFGSESGRLDVLLKAADILENENEDIKRVIRQGLQKGQPLVKARADALKTSDIDIDLKPNNTLAIEYIKTLKKFNSSIQPHTIKRIGCDYNDLNLSDSHLSATSIRNYIFNNNISLIKDFIPYTVQYNINSRANLEKLILYRLNMMTKDELRDIFDVGEGLENRIFNSLKFTDFNVFLYTLKTKRYTMARLKRILIAALLNITKEFYLNCLDAPPYVNVLAIRKERKEILSKIKTRNIYTKPSDIKKLSPEVLPLVNLDVLSHKLLNIINEDTSNLNSMQII